MIATQSLSSLAYNFKVNQANTMAQLCPYEYVEGVYIFRGIYAYYFPDTLLANPCEFTDFEMLERKGKQNKEIIDLANEILVYPNPVGDFINIVDLAQLKNAVDKIELFDLLGRKINLGREKTTVSNLTQLDLSGIGPGHYILKLSREKGQINTFKIVKK